MKIKKIEWKNVFSYGNSVETLEFDDNGSLWQICGVSGAGKTSIIQLPFLLLYGETINDIKLTSIPNRVNSKDSMIRGTLVRGSDEYVITRTFAPHTIAIQKNGENIDLPGIDPKQDYIKNEIMCGIPKNIYKNILTLSLDTDISFVNMGAKDKRGIVDFLLDMEVLNYYTELLKKDNASLTQSINESNGSINVLDRNLERAKTDLQNKETVLNSQQTKKDLDESEIRKNIEEINAQYKKGRLDYITTLNSKISELQTELSGISIKKGSTQTKLNQYNSQLNLLLQDKCPTCGSSFKTDSFDSIRNNLNELIKSTQEELNGYDTEINRITLVIKGKKDEITKLNGEIALIDSKIQELNNMILGSEKYKNAKSTYNSALDEVNRLESEKKEESTKVTKSEKEARLFSILKNVYGDSGVKKILREKYVPELNKEINESLKCLNIPYSFEFDNNFEAVIYDRGEVVEIKTLSAGEKQRTNMAVLRSLVKIVKNKYPLINMIALDETTSHIDSDNGSDAFKFFKKISEEFNVNIFVVTHNDIVDENIFDHRLFIEKIGPFSNITRK